MFAPDLFGRFPGYLSPSEGLKFADIPSTIDAVGKVPTLGWLHIFALAGALEAKNLAFPTNYGWPAFTGNINKLEGEERSPSETPPPPRARLRPLVHELPRRLVSLGRLDGASPTSGLRA